MAITAWITVQNCSTVTLPGRYGNSRNQPDTDIRSVQDNRAGETFAIGGEQGNRPSGLAVSIEDRRCPGMAARHFLDETTQGMEHVGDGLAWGSREGNRTYPIDQMLDVLLTGWDLEILQLELGELGSIDVDIDRVSIGEHDEPASGLTAGEVACDDISTLPFEDGPAVFGPARIRRQVRAAIFLLQPQSPIFRGLILGAYLDQLWKSGG